MFKKFILGSLVIFTSITVLAAQDDFMPGIYLGAQGGVAAQVVRDDSNLYDFLSAQKQVNDNRAAKRKPCSNCTFNYSSDIDDDTSGSWGGRLYIGWSIFKFLSLEAGYGFYPVGSRYKMNTTDKSQGVIYNGTPPQNNNYDFEYGNTEAIDLIAKAIFPMNVLIPGFNLSLYAKLGGAYMWTKFDGKSNGVKTSRNLSGIAPAFGIGIGYDITKNLNLDLSGTMLVGGGKIDPYTDNVGNIYAKVSGVPTVGLFALGLTYKFVY